MSHKFSCIIIDDEAIARDVLKTHLGRIDSIEILAECASAMEGLNILRSQKVDLIFLDINMPNISGISFAKSLPKDMKIIFTTAYREYAVEGFELQAVDYLLKPISFDRLLKAVNAYFEIHIRTKGLPISNALENVDYIFVRADRKMVKIDFDEIRYIESFSDYIKIHLANNTIITRENISSIEAKLPIKHFLRIHRSFIVSLNYIQSYTHDSIIINDAELSISRSYKKAVLNRLEVLG